MAAFLTIALGIWAAMHTYVFWRLGSVPWIAAMLSGRALLVVAAALWAGYPAARILNSWKLEALSRPLEFAAANWIGILFLLFSALLATDVVTLGGWLLPHAAPVLRGWVAAATMVLAIIGLVQGLRPPVVRDYEVRLAGLPLERDGLAVVAISDLHLGTLIGRRWMARLVQRINNMHPGLVLVVGDLVDGNAGQVEPLLPVLKQLRAPLGIWAVTGNHEYYAGADGCVQLFEAAGYSVLRDRCAQAAPGLVIAGVDDLTARRQFGAEETRPMEKALANRPAGAAILLSHSPWQIERAAAAGAGLVLCGHTHNGQIWPFNYLVASRYPLIGGRYVVAGMPVIVCRGTGTWGPRMRLWRPSEIVRIKLRRA
jgi:predicted MPP superfamily phosphohydrolase